MIARPEPVEGRAPRSWFDELTMSGIWEFDELTMSGLWDAKSAGAPCKTAALQQNATTAAHMVSGW
jgi:hypothetical protein